MYEVIDFLYKHGNLTHIAAYDAIKLLSGNGFRFTRKIDPTRYSE